MEWILSRRGKNCTHTQKVPPPPCLHHGRMGDRKGEEGEEKHRDVEEAGPLMSESRWSAGKILWEGKVGGDVGRKVNGEAGLELGAKAI